MAERAAKVAIAMGSNIGDKAGNIRAALELLAREPGVALGAVSKLYRTAPWGKTDQDWFVNGCALLTTRLAPLALLSRLKAVELAMGRQAGERWGPRLIDLDIIDYGGQALQSAELTLPHAQALERDFVMVPLAEIAPELMIAGVAARDAAAKFAPLPTLDGV